MDMIGSEHMRAPTDPATESQAACMLGSRSRRLTFLA